MCQSGSESAHAKFRGLQNAAQKCQDMWQLKESPLSTKEGFEAFLWWTLWQPANSPVKDHITAMRRIVQAQVDAGVVSHNWVGSINSIISQAVSEFVEESRPASSFGLSSLRNVYRAVEAGDLTDDPISAKPLITDAMLFDRRLSDIAASGASDAITSSSITIKLPVLGTDGKFILASGYVEGILSGGKTTQFETLSTVAAPTRSGINAAQDLVDLWKAHGLKVIDEVDDEGAAVLRTDYHVVRIDLDGLTASQEVKLSQVSESQSQGPRSGHGIRSTE